MAQFNTDFKDEIAFKKYLVNNILDLDPIEGIWNTTITDKSYQLIEGRKVFPVSIGSEERMVIYKKDGAYKSYPSQGDLFIWDCEVEQIKISCYTFEKTAKNGVYLYKQWDNNDFHSYHEGYAYLDGATLSMSRSGTEMKSYSTQFNSWEFEGIKLSPNPDDIEAARRENSKPVEPDKVSGTGFVIGNTGYLVTANHVVEGMNYITVKDLRNEESKRYSCVVVERDKRNDLVILKIVDDGFGGFQNIPYTLRSNKVQVGEDVFTLGYPLKSSMGEEIKLTNGIVSASSGFDGDTTMMQISVPVQHGNSGGPLFDKNGDLIGVVVSKHNGAENVSYAVKVRELKKLLKSLTVSTLPASSLTTNKDLPSKVGILKDYVFIIEAGK